MHGLIVYALRAQTSCRVRICSRRASKWCPHTTTITTSSYYIARSCSSQVCVMQRGARAYLHALLRLSNFILRCGVCLRSSAAWSVCYIMRDMQTRGLASSRQAPVSGRLINDAVFKTLRKAANYLNRPFYIATQPDGRLLQIHTMLPLPCPLPLTSQAERHTP